MVAKMLAEELGMDLEVHKVEWDSIGISMDSGEYDCIIAGMGRTSERMLSYSFTEPYYYRSNCVVVKKGTELENITGLSDLAGKNVIATTQLGTGWVPLLEQIPDVTLGANYETTAEVFMALSNETANVAVIDIPTAQSALLTNTDLKLITLADGDIEAEFLLDEESEENISEKANCTFEKETIITVSRYFDGHRTLGFDKYPSHNHTNISDDEGEETKVVTEEEFGQTLRNTTMNEVPKFVYYSNYGNLSSRIYLPHVVKWLNGETVTGVDINEEQVRTLRVLFDFVKLNPKEILALGIIPYILVKKYISKLFNTVEDDDFDDCYSDTLPIIQQVEAFAQKNSIDLAQGWKVEMAKAAKNVLKNKSKSDIDDKYITIWKQLFLKMNK